MRTSHLLPVLLLPTLALAAPPVALTTATYVAPAEDADLQGVAAAPDGTIYIVGNAAGRAKDLPTAAHLGPDMQSPRCGSAFVAHLSADGRTLLHFADLPKGALFATTVQATADAVYVSGYASNGLEPVIAGAPGLIHEYPRAKVLAAATQPGAKRDPLDRGPGLGRFGSPAVLRLDPALAQVTAGTYLEGWQQVWEKNRTSSSVRPMPMYREFFWQPAALAVLKSGDVIVSHDGGYGRDVTDADKKVAGDDAKLLGKLGFYDVPDHLSRLSPDLSKRLWKVDVYTPEISPENRKAIWPTWPVDHFGSPRTHRLRLDKDENVFVCGWSASATKSEPWWSPFLWKVNPADGMPVWKAYNQDPIAGADHRMHGNVADTACVTLALDDDGNVLTSLIADGGNSPVIGRSPKAEGDRFERFEGPVKEHVGVKLVHFWGQVSRIDGKTREGIAATQIGPWAWVTDMAAMPGKRTLAVGRYNDKFKLTDDAWNKDSLANPNGFVRVYGEDFSLLFSTSLPGVVPYELTRLSPTRYALAARAEKTDKTPLKDALADKPLGKSAGYLLVLDVPPAAP